MNAAQTIEQHMFAPAEEIDSLAVSPPVSEMSTTLIPVASTFVTVTEVVTISTADPDTHIRTTMGICGQLIAEHHGQDTLATLTRPGID